MAVLVKKASMPWNKRPPKVSVSRDSRACCVALLTGESGADHGACLQGGGPLGVLVCVVVMVSLYF